MNKVFERTRLNFGTPILERVTITGQDIHNEIIDLRNNKAFSVWDDTLQSMGHANEKALVDILKGYRYQLVN